MKIIKLIPVVISIVIITTNCNKINNKQENTKILLQKMPIENNEVLGTNKKINERPKKNNTAIKKDVDLPQFKEIKLDTPDKLLSTKYIKSLSSAELNLIRAKIYEKYSYNFYKLWGENFYKAKYGYIVKPKENITKKLNKQDKLNDSNILKQLKVNYKTKRLSLPIYIGHILREINFNKNRQKYFQNIEDGKQLPQPFNSNNYGIVKPIPQKEIDSKEWFNLVNGRKRLFELNIPVDKEQLYLVYYYNKDSIKYIVSYEAFFGQIGPQDIKNFSLYDRKGTLRRNIFVGNQETYERDYIYNEEKEIYKIVEKIIQKNSFIKVKVYELK